MLAAAPRPEAIRPVGRRGALAAVAAAVGAAALAAAPVGWAGLWSVAWLLLAAVAWRWPVAGLLTIALAIPFEQQWTIPTIAGIQQPMAYTVWAVAAGAGPKVARDRRVLVDRIGVAQLAVVMALVASWASGGARFGSWWQVVEAWLLAALVYIIARSLRLRSPDRWLLIAALALGIVLNGIMGVWQLATGAGPPSYTVGGAVRIFGEFLHPNTLASYLAFAVPVLLAVAFRPGWGSGVLIARVGATVGVGTLLLTQSRGGVLALGLATLVMLALAPRSLQRRAVVASIAIALVIVAAGAVDRVPGIDRFATIAAGEETVQVTTATWGQREREAHWGAARAMMTDHPFFGVGAGEFNDNYRQYTPEWRFRVGRGHAHNAYLQLGAEAGVSGLAAFVLWVGTILVALGRRVSRSVGLDRALTVGALGTAVAWVANNVFEYPDVASVPILFVLIVALGMGGASAPPRDRRAPAGDSPS
jgi:O-antigen ligase